MQLAVIKPARQRRTQRGKRATAKRATLHFKLEPRPELESLSELQPYSKPEPKLEPSITLKLANAKHELACAVATLAETQPIAERCKAAEQAAALKSKAAEATAAKLSLQALSGKTAQEHANAARAAARQAAASAAAASRNLCEARGTIHAATADVATAKRTLQHISSAPNLDTAAPVCNEPRCPPSPPTVITTPLLEQPTPPPCRTDRLRVAISLTLPTPTPPGTNLQKVTEQRAVVDDELRGMEPSKNDDGECVVRKHREIEWLEERERERESGSDADSQLDAIRWLEEREQEHDSEYEWSKCDVGGDEESEHDGCGHDKSERKESECDESEHNREAIEWLEEREHEHDLSDGDLSDDGVHDSFDEYYLLYE